MLQRAVIAMALASEPSLLILDEPTTALDATVEAEVLDLVTALRREFGTSLLFISHNLGVIARMCDRVGVLYAGELVEEGPARRCFTTRAIRTPSGCCAASRAATPTRRRDALDTIPGFLPAPGESCRRLRLRRPLRAGSRTAAAPRRRRCTRSAPARRSRCHFHERAQTLPRREPARPPRPRPGRTAPSR